MMLPFITVKWEKRNVLYIIKSTLLSWICKIRGRHNFDNIPKGITPGRGYDGYEFCWTCRQHIRKQQKGNGIIL